MLRKSNLFKKVSESHHGLVDTVSKKFNVTETMINNILRVQNATINPEYYSGEFLDIGMIFYCLFTVLYQLYLEK